MRIAVWHNLPSGGGKRALHDHVRGLVARGHDVEVWCPACADRSYMPLADLAPEHVLPWNAPKPKPWLLPSVRRYALEVRGRLAELDRHCRAAAAEINTGGFDVLFANSCSVSAAAPIG